MHFKTSQTFQMYISVYLTFILLIRLGFSMKTSLICHQMSLSSRWSLKFRRLERLLLAWSKIYFVIFCAVYSSVIAYKLWCMQNI